MKTTGVSGIPKFGLLDFLGHPTFQPLNFGHWTILQFQKSIIETCLGAEGLIVEGKLLIFLKHRVGHSGSGRVSAKYIRIRILITIKAFVKDFQQSYSIVI